MTHAHDPLRRFGAEAAHIVRATRATTTIANTPDLPAIDFTAPTLLTTPSGTPPKADVVVITWAEAEWAAMQHVFCAGASPMPYADRNRSKWPGWHTYAGDLPDNAPKGWTEWGSYRLVEIGGQTVLLFKSNTHLDYPGATFLTTLIGRLISIVAPTLILSIGTAGGARPTDHIGTVRAVSAGTLYEANQPASAWPDYGNAWTARLDNAGLAGLLVPIPATTDDLQALATGLNDQLHADYTLAQLDPGGLNLGTTPPLIGNDTGGGTSLLTTSTFVVGTTAGDFQTFDAIEMDDAVVGAACAAAGVAFGFIRNISDPVQNAALPAKAQGAWGGVVYDAYGLYTSVNGALAAWAALSGG